MRGTEENVHSLVMAFADEEEQPPGLNGGQDEGSDAHDSDEAAGGWGAPLFYNKPLLGHRDVLVLPHPSREKEAFSSEILCVLREGNNRDEAEDEGQKIQDALCENKIIFGHFRSAAAPQPRSSGNAHAQ